MNKLTKVFLLLSLVTSPVYLNACTTGENRIEDRNEIRDSRDRDLTGGKGDPDLNTDPQPHNTNSH